MFIEPSASLMKSSPFPKRSLTLGRAAQEVLNDISKQSPIGRKSPFESIDQHQHSRLSIVNASTQLDSRLKQGSVQSLLNGGQSLALSEHNYFGAAPDMQTLKTKDSV